MTFTPLVDVFEPLITQIKEYKLIICPVTGKLKRNKRWVHADVEKEIKKQVKKRLTLTDVDSIEIEVHDREKNHIPVTIYVSKENEHQSFDTQVAVEQQQCPDVTKIESNYFEGVLQLRECNAQLFSQLKPYLSRLTINKHSELKNGYDLQVTDKKVMRSVADRIHKHFGGAISYDPTVHSYDHQKSKDIIRLQITLTFFPFKKFDVVRGPTSTYGVLQVGNMIKLKDLNTQEITSLTAQQARDYEKVPSFPLEQTRDSPNIYVLHPTNFQEVQLEMIDDNQKIKNLRGCPIGERVFYCE